MFKGLGTRLLNQFWSGTEFCTAPGTFWRCRWRQEQELLWVSSAASIKPHNTVHVRFQLIRIACFSGLRHDCVSGLLIYVSAPTCVGILLGLPKEDLGWNTHLCSAQFLQVNSFQNTTSQWKESYIYCFASRVHFFTDLTPGLSYQEAVRAPRKQSDTSLRIATFHSIIIHYVLIVWKGMFSENWGSLHKDWNIRLSCWPSPCFYLSRLCACVYMFVCVRSIEYFH